MITVCCEKVNNDIVKLVGFVVVSLLEIGVAVAVLEIVNDKSK